MSPPRIAIVGKPNVGKSTLFNRLCRRKLAIVTDKPGATRDRKEYAVEFGDLFFILMDTAGWEHEHQISQLKSSMMEQTKKSATDADIILFVVDGKSGLTNDDLEFTNLIRKMGKKTILIVNKSESKTVLETNELMKLGLGEATFISAEHGLGLDYLYYILTDALEEYRVQNDLAIEQPKDRLLLAIIGRPNAGKSTIFNKILGFERSIISPESGTTRDAIAHDIIFESTTVSLIDTAGLRKKSKVVEGIEKMSAGQTITAIRRANVVALVIDATQGLEQQDLAIAHMTINEGKGLILIFNKCDLIEDKKVLHDHVDYVIEHSLTDVLNIPILYTNALTGRNISNIIASAIKVQKSWSENISTSRLNKWLIDVTSAHAPSFASDGRAIKFKYITQIRSRPPTFKVFVNVPKAVTKQYLRYLNHELQRSFNFTGVPVRIICSVTENPYDNR
jgi:GTPase